jgi:hypothetical protein
VTVVADERARDAAVEQSRFRAANEWLLRIVASYRFEAEDRAPFICECADHGCFETVMLSLKEYERVRATPSRFVVVSGHEEDQATHERVRESEYGYAVVQKIGLAGAEAARRSARTALDIARARTQARLAPAVSLPGD